jgi:hypothetical protein
MFCFITGAWGVGIRQQDDKSPEKQAEIPGAPETGRSLAHYRAGAGHRRDSAAAANRRQRRGRKWRRRRPSRKMPAKQHG